MNSFLKASSEPLGQKNVNHEGVITGRDGFNLRLLLDPKGVVQFTLPINLYKRHTFLQMPPSTLADEPKVLSLAIKRMSIFDDPL